MRQFLVTTCIVFTCVFAGWITRMILGFPIVVNGYSVPVWWSVIPLIVTGGMATWAFRLMKTART